MKNQFIYFFSFISSLSFSQEIEKLGVKFIFSDSLITFINIDKKLKVIKIIESDYTAIVDFKYSANYEIEGDVIQEQKIYTKNGEINIEIIADKIKIKFIIHKYTNANSYINIKDGGF